MADLSNVRVNGQRLWDALMEMAKIGATPKGGCKRLTLTDLDKQGRELFRAWCEKEGCTVEVDEMGNMFATRAGVENDLAPVLIGSHLDTQPTGGKFDGVLGVLGGLEVVRSLNDLKIKTRRPIIVANWTNEEGSRYAPAMVSSGVFAGVYTKEFAYSRLDADGKTLGDELTRIGFRGDKPIGGFPIHASFELHIEQGPILEDENIDIGVVTHGQGQRWYEIKLTGFESHAGSTPMPRRKDALLGAARIVELVNKIGLSKAPLAVSTVRRAQPLPELAQRNSGRSVHDLGVPPPRRCDALRDGRGAEGGRRGDRQEDRPDLRPQAGLLLRAGRVRQRLRLGGAARPPSISATATATSSPAPATTPAISRASARPR